MTGSISVEIRTEYHPRTSLERCSVYEDDDQDCCLVLNLHTSQILEVTRRKISEPDRMKDTNTCHNVLFLLTQQSVFR